jgi:hypothetical protein
MNDIESRLAEAMAARAREVEPRDEDDALSRISERVNMNRRRGLTVLGVAAALVVVVGAVALLRRDDKGQNVKVDPAGTTSTTVAPTTPASVIPSAGPTPIWPFASMNRTFATPEEAAKSFAIDYLGMTHARVGHTLVGNVEIFPNDRGNARTLVHVEERAPRGWVVLGADANEIAVDQPKAHDVLTNPLPVAGRSAAFEAQIGVELRPFGSMPPLVQDFVMGGSSDLQPFSKAITVPATDRPLVLILFEGDASGAQTYTKATVIPLDGPLPPSTFVGTTTSGDVSVFDFAGHVQPAGEKDQESRATIATLPSNVQGSLPALRGRFGTVAFFDGSQISSYNPANGNVVQLVQPAAKPISLDADASGRHLLWVDANHDLWKWSGGEPVKVGTGFNFAAW